MCMVLSISYTALELAVSVFYKSMSTFINSFEVGPIVGGQVGEICEIFILVLMYSLKIYGNLRHGWEALCLIGAALVFLCLVLAFFCTGEAPLYFRFMGKLRRRVADSV